MKTEQLSVLDLPEVQASIMDFVRRHLRLFPGVSITHGAIENWLDQEGIERPQPLQYYIDDLRKCGKLPGKTVINARS